MVTSGSLDLLEWLRNRAREYVFDAIAVYKLIGDHGWPLEAEDEQDLARQLGDGGHLLPLPKEPAALANVVEVSLVNFVLEQLERVTDAVGQRGTERGYPDVEVTGGAFGAGFHAVDIKVARRGASRKLTQSRVTLYTGNTYFRYPTLKWPGTFRPFEDYSSHIVMICVYTLDEALTQRVTDLEVIVQPSWRVGSKQRSSTTREYIGAIQNIDDLRNGKGSFANESEFYAYWRKFNFRIGRSVQQQLDRLLKEQGPGQVGSGPIRDKD